MGHARIRGSRGWVTARGHPALAGQARSLLVEKDGRDHNSHVIVADGPLRNVGIDPYDVTERFFRHPDVDINYVVFGYDWRRPLSEAAEYLEYFLTHLRSRVFDVFLENPLPDLTLLAHSQGGLVAKLFLHRFVDIEPWMKQLITVATPFYGTWSHQQRYFIGHKELNEVYSPEEVARIIATLPGPYNLMFLPRSTFAEFCDRIGLDRYPIRTPDDQDGFDPYDDGNIALYPQWVSPSHLRNAKETARILGSTLPPHVADKVHNIRSSTCKDTPVELVWNPLPVNFRPDDEKSPIVSGKPGDGDGTVPAWAAYHVSVPDGNRTEFHETKQHFELMEDCQVLKHVYGLIKDSEGAPEAQILSVVSQAARESTGYADTCSTEEVQSLFEKIARAQTAHEVPWLGRPEMWRGI